MCNWLEYDGKIEIKTGKKHWKLRLLCHCCVIPETCCYISSFCTMRQFPLTASKFNKKLILKSLNSFILKRQILQLSMMDKDKKKGLKFNAKILGICTTYTEHWVLEMFHY